MHDMLLAGSGVAAGGEACAMRGDRAGEVAARAGDLGTVCPDTACRYLGRTIKPLQAPKTGWQVSRQRVGNAFGVRQCSLWRI